MRHNASASTSSVTSVVTKTVEKNWANVPGSVVTDKITRIVSSLWSHRERRTIRLAAETLDWPTRRDRERLARAERLELHGMHREAIAFGGERETMRKTGKSAARRRADATWDVAAARAYELAPAYSEAAL